MYEEASLVAQMVKSLPAMWETQVQTLGWEDPLEKGMAIHSSILAWRIPRTKKPGRLQSMGLQKSQTRLSNEHFISSFILYRLFSTGDLEATPIVSSVLLCPFSILLTLSGPPSSVPSTVLPGHSSLFPVLKFVLRNESDQLRATKV